MAFFENTRKPTKLIEGGDDLAASLELDENERELLEHCIVQMGIHKASAFCHTWHTLFNCLCNLLFHGGIAFQCLSI